MSLVQRSSQRPEARKVAREHAGKNMAPRLSPGERPEMVAFLRPAVQRRLAASTKDGVGLGAATAVARDLVELSQYFLKPTGAKSLLGAALSRHAEDRPEVEAVEYFPTLGVLVGSLEGPQLAALRRDRRVNEVGEAPDLELIRTFDDGEIFAEPPDDCAWALELLRVPALWKRGVTGKDVLIGHLDTGADAAHPALARRIHSHVVVDARGSTRITVTSKDSGVHGTHTAGILVGKSSPRFGVAPGALLASATVIEGGNAFRRVIRGLQWVLEQQVRVINLSLGFRRHQTSPVMQRIMQVVRARGALPVCAIGNDGPGVVRYPAAYKEALSVGAVGRTGRTASFSSRGSLDGRKLPSVLAPGEGIVSARPGGQYMSDSGTSMAAPHVAGLAALLLEAWPRATVDELHRAIVKSKNGRGLVDAVKAEASLARQVRRRR